MFLGVNSHTDAKRVSSYETAREALERASLTPKGRQRTAKQYGFHLGMSRNHGVTWVREDVDGSIVFRLYDTDVVVWYPNGAVGIENFGSVTTSDFAQRFLPAGLHLRYPVERRGACGGDKGIVYAPTSDTPWEGRRICFGDFVLFHPDGGGWVPDESTCEAMEFPDLTGSTRELSKRYSLSDFELWLPAAAALLNIEHDSWDVDECAAALERRDFRTAATFMPLIKVSSAFGIADRIKPLQVATRWRDEVVTLGSFRKLRLALCERDGLFTTMSCKTIGRNDFEKRMARVREMAALGIDVAHFGPDR